MNLLVVESPAKAKTINKYLGSDFEVIATVGHFRDLAKKDGVQVSEDQNDITLNWETTSAGLKMIDTIEKKASGYDQIYLATDPDREGEAITWHLIKSLEKKVDNNKFKRITFNEITKNAVINSFEKARNVDEHLVSAYLARRSLDYLAGYNFHQFYGEKCQGVDLRVEFNQWQLDSFMSEKLKLSNLNLINFIKLESRKN